MATEVTEEDIDPLEPKECLLCWNKNI